MMMINIDDDINDREWLHQNLKISIKKSEKIIRIKAYHSKKGLVKAHNRKIKIGNKKKESEKSSLDPDNLEKIESINDCISLNVLGGIHEFESYVCEFRSGDKSIHKTMPDDNIAGEVGAYDISKIIGWDIVPETIKVDYGKGSGSSQKWIPDTKEPKSGYCDEVETAIKEVHFDDLSKIFVIDMLTGNFDRHEGNILIDKNNKCWAIDNEDWGKYKHAKLHIESLKEHVRDGDGVSMPMINVLENSLGDDIGLWKKFNEHVNKNLDTALKHKDEIRNYWSQYKDIKITSNKSISAPELIKYVDQNINYLENYRNEVKI